MFYLPSLKQRQSPVKSAQGVLPAEDLQGKCEFSVLSKGQGVPAEPSDTKWKPAVHDPSSPCSCFRELGAGRTEMGCERNNVYFPHIAARMAEIITALITCMFIFMKSVPAMTLWHHPLIYTQTLYLIHLQSRVSKSFHILSGLSFLSDSRDKVFKNNLKRLLKFK